MAVFNITLDNAEAYLKAISGLTSLTSAESEVLATIIDFMLENNLKVLDDQVKAKVIEQHQFSKQTYYNLICKLRKKKLLLNSHSKTQLKPLLLPGTILEIKFQERATALTEFEVSINGKEAG